MEYKGLKKLLKEIQNRENDHVIIKKDVVVEILEEIMKVRRQKSAEYVRRKVAYRQTTK